MPMTIDTAVHLSGTGDAVVRDLKQRAYFGESAAQSMGTGKGDLLPVRNETIPGAARYVSAGGVLTGPEPGRPNVAPIPAR